MPTECIPEQVQFQGHGFRKAVADFSGSRITSDRGGLLLREIAIGTKLLERFADCFIDNRNQGMTQESARYYRDFRFRTLKSWSRSRRFSR